MHAVVKGSVLVALNAAKARLPVPQALIAPPRHLRPTTLALLILIAAYWGVLVDGAVIPVLAPTSNSTLFQASTAALFALLGIFGGPLAGALGGLVRDGSGYLLTLALHPALVAQPGFLAWLGRAVVDVVEDVVLGLIPGLVALRTRRISVLAASAAATAWLSLPYLVAGSVLSSGRPGDLWVTLTTAAGDWNEPVDPGLTVYALVTGALVAAAAARWASRPRRALGIGLLFALPALLLLALGAHA